jgi:hypothetical protein
MPIWSPGGAEAEAQRVDIRGLIDDPSRVELTYERKSSERPMDYYKTLPGCQDADWFDGSACHEFPMWSTKEGGVPGAGAKPPAVGYVPSSVNSRHGAYYGAFATRCGFASWVAPRTPRFLVIPTPEPLGMASTGLCNGSYA